MFMEFTINLIWGNNYQQLDAQTLVNAGWKKMVAASE